MTEPINGFLGRIPSEHDERTLPLAVALQPSLPPPPPSVKRYGIITDWGVMGNDRAGNCTIVTAAHAILAWRACELMDTRRITDAAAIDLSEQMGAMNGFSILNRLKYWRTKGMWSDRLWAFTAVDPRSKLDHQLAITYLGASDIGLQLPTAWRTQEIWSTGIGRKYHPNSWGPHSVPLVEYDDRYAYCITWGRRQRITWEAITEYCDEAFAMIDANWLAQQGVSPPGLDLPALCNALRTIGANDPEAIPRAYRAS